MLTLQLTTILSASLENFAFVDVLLFRLVTEVHFHVKSMKKRKPSRKEERRKREQKEERCDDVRRGREEWGGRN